MSDCYMYGSIAMWGYFHCRWSLDLLLPGTYSGVLRTPYDTVCPTGIEMQPMECRYGTALVRPVHEQFLILILLETWGGALCNDTYRRLALVDVATSYQLPVTSYQLRYQDDPFHVFQAYCAEP